MALYSYVKVRYSRARKVAQVASIFFIFSGSAILFLVIYPILSFELFYGPKLAKLISPIPNEIIKQALSGEISVLGASNIDYTKASVWFPKAVNIRLATTNSFYTLTIPKLNINNANVMVGAEDLSKSLIHFTGPLPGNSGTPVIFGHSSLPILYNPTNYNYIFTKLTDLKKGDSILIKSDNVTYQYKVFDMHVTTPDDLTVLQQSYDYQYITLITCVPQGTYLYRYIVKARLEKI